MQVHFVIIFLLRCVVGCAPDLVLRFTTCCPLANINCCFVADQNHLRYKINKT
uniref:Uncharacterized protein n=1 Tax=Anguilla anguilla TaxID=7936 RepID=A0A0E9QYF5_ANGAN